MADPVIVASGQTFERSCAQACRELGFVPLLPDDTYPDLSTLIPNLALRSAILNWCDASASPRPRPIDADSARHLVRSLIDARKGRSLDPQSDTPDEIAHDDIDKDLLNGVSNSPPRNNFHSAETELNRRRLSHFDSSSGESAIVTPLPLATRPLCYSSSSSSLSEANLAPDYCDIDGVVRGDNDEEDEIVSKLRSLQVFEQEEAVSRLRGLTRNSPESRVPLCSARLLGALRPLLGSRYAGVQTNAVATVVNLSLEKPNKVHIVRAGLVPLLIDALRGGSTEAQEHAAGALFSLALDDENKTAIGVLGALPPLLHTLRSGADRARQDAALALYHLTLAQSNRSKLIKYGYIPTLLAVASRPDIAGRVLIILCNVASSLDGRVALLDSDAVEVLVDILKRKETENATLEHCVAALYALSQCNLRFRGSAKAVGAMEVLASLADRGSERARQKIKRMLMVLKEKEGGFEAVTGDDEKRGEEIGEDGERASDLVVVVGAYHRHQYPLHKGKNISGAYSTEF